MQSPSLYLFISHIYFLTTLVFASSSNTSYTSPDVYPSRMLDVVIGCLTKLSVCIANITGAGGWETALARAEDFLNQLTLAEKAYLVTGVTG